MADILIYDSSGNRVAMTSKTFAIMEKKELMRTWTLDFGVVNTDNSRQYITPTSVFQIAGQKFNLTDFKQNSGSNNITTATAEHVSYALNDYTIPAGYAFVGTVAAIISDMLNVSGANAKFTVGTCAAISGSFAPNNTQPLNLKAALLQLITLGVEIDFDNFAILAPVRIGTDNGKIFQFGRDLVDLDRTYNKSQNTMTYDIKIATLMRLPGALSSDTFAVGDTVITQDVLIGDSVTKRICCYDKCHDDPTQDGVTIGQFINDSTSQTVSMQMDISATAGVAGEAQTTADGAASVAANSVQQAVQYSNVSIDHINGFMAVSGNNLMRTKNNSVNGFTIERYYNNQWIIVWQADSVYGKTISYNLDRTQKVEMGGSFGYASYKSDGIGGWIQTGGMTADGQSIATRLTTPDNSTAYGEIGKNQSGPGYGLYLYNGGNQFFRIDEISGTPVISTNSADGFHFDASSFSFVNIDFSVLATIDNTRINFELRPDNDVSKQTGLFISQDSIQLKKNGAVVATW
jgi:hypothetical protein